MKNLIFSFKQFIIVSSLSLFLIVGCDSTEPNESSLSLSFATQNSFPKIAAKNLIIEDVKLLLRNIKIKHQASKDSLHVKVGPFIVNLNMENKTTEFSSTDIPEGIYNRVRFEIHKLADSETPPDPEFKDSSERYSVIIKGTFNDMPFVYKSKKSAVQDVKLEEDLVIGENEDINLTIMVEPYSWFYDGNIVLDPNDERNESMIDNNLKDGFKRAFRDKNRDGILD